MTTKEISQMSVSQRITLVEEIWDSINSDIELAKPTSEEKEYVEGRLAEIRANGERLVNWNVVKASARNNKKC